MASVFAAEIAQGRPRRLELMFRTTDAPAVPAARSAMIWQRGSACWPASTGQGNWPGGISSIVWPAGGMGLAS